jgi:hypothetical protein
MIRFFSMVCAALSFLAIGVNSQVVTFNSPLSWVTQRNDSITVRCQIDTAQLKGKKQFAVTVSEVNQKQQKKLLAKKTFPINDYSGEFAMGPVGTVLTGGFDYIKIDWSIPGTQNKGYLSPIGVVALDKLAPPPLSKVVKAQDGADAAGVAGAVKESDFQNIGQEKIAFAWNKEALHMVLVKQQKPATYIIRIALDGKNGKNAFLSFADRSVNYKPSNDSLWGLHFVRSMIGDTLQYVTKAWPNEVKKTVAGDKIVIQIPWYDSGIIPFGERKFAMCITTFEDKNKQLAALHAKANFFLPGTWGDFELAK